MSPAQGVRTSGANARASSRAVLKPRSASEAREEGTKVITSAASSRAQPAISPAIDRAARRSPPSLNDIKTSRATPRYAAGARATLNAGTGSRQSVHTDTARTTGRPQRAHMVVIHGNADTQVA